MPWECKSVEKLREEFVIAAQGHVNFSSLVGTIVVSITDAIDKASMIFDFAGYGCSTSVEMSCDIRK